MAAYARYGRAITIETAQDARVMQLAKRMHRLGTESAFEVLARAQRLAQAGRSIINLGIGQPDFPTPGNIVAAAHRKRSPTATTATPRRTASCCCARRSPKTS